MIKINELTKTFGDLIAVDRLSLEVPKGETLGLLGSNGAGKTTTISMLVGGLRPDSGTIEINGIKDPRQPECRRAIGLAPQSLALYDKLSAAENLEFFGGIYGLKGNKLKAQVDWCLELAGLEDRRKDLVETYSGGMKRRLNLACGLLHEPSVLLLDEPTVGVDPQSRNHIFEAIENLSQDGLTVIYTTHYMEEAERLCDRVAIIDKGGILAHDTVDRLIRTHGGTGCLQVEFAAPPKDLSIPGAEVDGSTVRIQTDDPLTVMDELRKNGSELLTFHLDRANLESVFLNLSGRSLRDT
jgi:ABC-2 type transport system ATP-binding protein